MKRIAVFLCFLLSIVAAKGQLTVADTLFDRSKCEDTFAFGADISWLSQQESWNTVYRNRAGRQTELMTILQEEEGINAVRFRVWVNPSGGWSGKQDVIGLCKRAYAKGLRIMLDFHYSDTWADPGKQTIPAAWTDTSVEALCQNVYDHTFDVLSSLKQIGIVPEWVQIGNETKQGMLWETGRTSTTEGFKNFAALINSGYKAIKDVDEGILAIVHLPDGHDNSLYRWMFDALKTHGAKWDVIGVSAYPRWSKLDISTAANITSTINKYMANIRDIKSRYGTPVMVVETGHYNNKPLEANNFLAEFMKSLIDTGVLGCFYWEPEAMSGYDLGAWNPETHQASIAMDAFKGIKYLQVSKYFNTLSVQSPRDTLMSVNGADIELKVRAKTGNKATEVSKVDFYLNSKLVGTQTEYIGLLRDYIVNPEPLDAGAYDFHAIATDTQGNTQSTDTVSFIVGPYLLLDEDSRAWQGCSDGKGKVESTNKMHTGSGYINSDDEKGVSTAWRVHFPEAGRYPIAIRYSTKEEKTSAYVMLDDASKTIATFQPTTSLNKWSMTNKTLTVTDPGTYSLALRAMYATGLPNIDYLAVFSPNTANPATEDLTANSVNTLHNNIDTSFPVVLYDLSGRVTQQPRGIIVQKGQKVWVKE